MAATLLDFDGVLVDSEPVHLAAFNDVLAPYGIAISPREYDEHYVSLDDAGAFARALAHAGRPASADEVAALVAAKSPRFLARFEESFRVFPGAEEFIRRRRRRGLVGIVSGALEREIVFALDRMGVRDEIAFIVSAESTAASKPDPAPFVFARAELARLGHAGAAIAVEDSLGGIASARGAGLPCVAVTNTFPADRLRAAGAEVAVATLADLDDATLDGAAR